MKKELKEKSIIKTIVLPEGLYLKLKELAKNDLRNETAEIRYILTKYINNTK